MDSHLHYLPLGNADTKTAFHKPSNDASNRKYRRYSPASGSSSSDGSPKHDDSSSLIPSKGDFAEHSVHTQRRKDGQRELDRDFGRSGYGRNDDSYRPSDRLLYGSSHIYPRHDDYIRNNKYANEEERKHQRLSSRSVRESRGEHTKLESEHSRSIDYSRNVDKYPRDRYDGSGHRSKDKEKDSSSLERHVYKDKVRSSDRAGFGRRHTSSNSDDIDRDRLRGDRDDRDEKKDYRMSLGEFKSDHTVPYDGHRFKEADKRVVKDMDDQKLYKEEKKKCDDRDTMRDRERSVRASDYSEDKTVFVSENRESAAKKPKLISSDRGIDYGKDADEKQFPLTKHAPEIGGKVTLGQVPGNGLEASKDLNAAKVAAMKAAELVNKNLVGVGFMSTDQKKKLLWGKKSTTAEESGHHWNTALIGDRERQEKFNKLMSLRLPWYLWPLVGCERRCDGGAETRQPGGQWPSSSREAEGTPVGFGEAIRCWTSKKRWSHRWIRSLSNFSGSRCLATVFCGTLFYYWAEILILVILYLCRVFVLSDI
ncbi:hypothetical protein CFOL_v3_31821 [Cephalotus follicularis]|uniref:Uncharacterized protein n=1 Tax=Cephalotus follicularis TaxID=3775 RepID=A0A1Q3D813_CEPFO|nr:hypothetical protein CFOL_v3_31821 [Cephalotus follicularis]